MLQPTDLIGTWHFVRDGERAFLHFTYTQAFDYLADGDVRQMLRLSYSLEEPDSIRFRIHPGDPGWTCTLRLDGDTLVITSDQMETVCTRARGEEIPAWFIRELAGTP